MLRLATCVVASCDVCGVAYNEDDPDGHTVHFGDQEAAEAFLALTADEDYGWRVRSGGRLSCAQCASEQDCATYGHKFDLWGKCRCGGRIPGHHSTAAGTCPETERRWCVRCFTGQSRPTSSAIARG